MSESPPAPAPRWRRWLALGAVAAIVLPLLSLLPYLTSGTEVVKLRNAVLLQGELAPDFDWAAPPAPPGFLVDQAPFDPYFVDIVRRLELEALPTDWDRALAISRHLLGSSTTRAGGPIQADLRRTHAAIVERGAGYCADYVRAFMAIASAAGMPVRAWAFSFDGFGGHGHIWPEIWNREDRRWQLVGVFSNFSFHLDEPEPLSAYGLRRALIEHPDRLRFQPLEPAARPGWSIEAKARDYFRRGLDEWYLLWGSNVLEVESSAAFRALNPLSYRLAQVGAVVQGVHPGLRLLRTEGNGERIDALRRLRWQLFAATASMPMGVVALLVLAITRRRGETRTNRLAERPS